MSDQSDQARALLAQAQDLIARASALIGPDRPVPISTPDALDRALAAAVPGQAVVLATSLVYPGVLTVPRGVTVQSETWSSGPTGQIAADEPAPRFLAGAVCTGDGHAVLGVEIRQLDPRGTIAVMAGSGAVWDRVRVLGDPKLGAKRGIDFRGGSGTISRSRVAYIFQPKQDTQAVYSQEMLPGGGLDVRTSYLSAAGEVFMLGGGDSSSEAAMPSNATLSGCVLEKLPEWLALSKDSTGRDMHAEQVKNGIELKAVKGFKASGCTLVNCGGISDGQSGAAIVVTPRNQGGKAPWSRVEGATFEDITIDGGSGILNLLGSDNVNPSGIASGIALRRIAATNLGREPYGKDPQGNWQAHGWLFQVDRAPAGVVLDTISASALPLQSPGGIKALGVFTGKAPPTGLAVSKMDLPKGTTYGWRIDGSVTGFGGSGRAALLKWMPDAVLDDTVV